MTPELEIRRLALLSAQGMVAVLQNEADRMRLILEDQSVQLNEAQVELDSARETVARVQGRLSENVSQARIYSGQYQTELDWINTELGKIEAKR